MAASSITDSIVVNNPMVLVKYVEAMERLAETREPLTTEERDAVCSDPEELKTIFMKRVCGE